MKLSGTPTLCPPYLCEKCVAIVEIEKPWDAVDDDRDFVGFMDDFIGQVIPAMAAQLTERRTLRLTGAALIGAALFFGLLNAPAVIMLGVAGAALFAVSAGMAHAPADDAPEDEDDASDLPFRETVE